MKRIPLLFMLLLALTPSAFSRKMHTYGEILVMCSNSKYSYLLNTKDSVYDAPDRSNLLNTISVTRTRNGNSYYPHVYEGSKTAKLFIAKGDSILFARNPKDAREQYLKAYSLDSSDSRTMTYIGQTYEFESNFETAITWYNKAIKINYIDYMPHWFLANTYYRQDKNEKALDEVIIALILNRNNPRLLKLTEDIFKANNLKYGKWVFNPQYKLTLIDSMSIRIDCRGEWLGYASIKAANLLEPDLKDSLGNVISEYTLFHESECLMGIVNNLKEEVQAKYPELRGLDLAIKNKMTEEYIYYEIILPKRPDFAFQFSEGFIDKMKKYIILAHSEKN